MSVTTDSELDDEKIDAEVTDADAEATDAEEGSPEPDGGKPVRSWRRVIGVGVALLTGWWDQFIVWVQVRFVTDTQLPI